VGHCGLSLLLHHYSDWSVANNPWLFKKLRGDPLSRHTPSIRRHVRHTGRLPRDALQTDDTQGQSERNTSETRQTQGGKI